MILSCTWNVYKTMLCSSVTEINKTELVQAAGPWISLAADIANKPEIKE